LPLVLGAFLALLGLATVAHALVTSVRRRRHELAVLRTLGFRRADIRATIAWQSTALAVLGLALGIPAGAFVGAYAWGRVADGLGVSTTASLRWLPFVGVVVGVLLVVNALGAFAAARAVRISPARALATE
jgi:ABC-type lipoprotein release transport system permease subunit